MYRLLARKLAMPALLATMLLPQQVAGQMQWSRTTALGYAAAGTALAIIPAYASDSYGGLAYFPAGALLGVVVGHVVGEAAERSLARGDTLSLLHRSAVRVGTVAAGVGVGGLASAAIINWGEQRTFGGDEAIFKSFLAGGAVAGVLIQVLLDAKLWPNVPVESRLHLLPSGGAALAVAYRF